MKSRILILYGASTFFPVLGLLVVGQYSAPVLLGAALLMWAIRKESALGTAFAFGLLTFKPHLGLIIAVIMVVWLFFNRKKPFARQAIVFTFCSAVLLFFTGFLADRTWPISYIRTLGQYLGISGVHSCGICASLPVMLVEILNGYRNIYLGAAISIFLATGMAGLLLRHFGAQLLNETLVITLAAAFTLLVDPYLLGYDFILLVIVFVVLIERDLSIIGKLGIIVAYLLPWIILLLGRDGYFVLLVSTVILMTLLWNFPKQTSLKIDV